MTTYPRSEVIIASDFLSEHPTGSKVKIRDDYLIDHCELFNPSIDVISGADWEILNYYYLVGSRGNQMVGLVIGIEYKIWATMSMLKVVPNNRYANVLKRRDCRVFKGGPVRHARLKDPINPYREKYCVMIITKLEDLDLS